MPIHQRFCGGDKGKGRSVGCFRDSEFLSIARQVLEKKYPCPDLYSLTLDSPHSSIHSPCR